MVQSLKLSPLKWRKEVQYRLRLVPCHRYSFVWLCSHCRDIKKRNWGRLDVKCYKCGSTEPFDLYVRKTLKKDHVGFKNNSAANLLVGLSKDIAAKFSLDALDVLSDIRPERVIETTDNWYTQLFNGEKELVGELDWDICFQYTPLEIRKIMAETSMMQIRLPKDLHRWFRKFSQRREVTMTEVITFYLEGLRSRHTDIKIEQIEEL